MRLNNMRAFPITYRWATPNFNNAWQASSSSMSSLAINVFFNSITKKRRCMNLGVYLTSPSWSLLICRQDNLHFVELHKDYRSKTGRAASTGPDKGQELWTLPTVVMRNMTTQLMTHISRIVIFFSSFGFVFLLFSFSQFFIIFISQFLPFLTTLMSIFIIFISLKHQMTCLH